MSRFTAALALVALMTSACGKKEIERLEGALAASQDLVMQRESTISGLEAEVSTLQGRVASLERDLQAKIQELADTEARYQAELAAEQERSARILADRGALRLQVDDMQRAMAELAERKRQAEARVRAFKDLVSRFQSLIDAGTLDVRIIDGRMVVIMATDILFASGSADLSAEGKTSLAAVAQILAPMTDRHFQVEGHTDDVPIKTSRFPNNWYLAAARAIGVVEHLVANGMGAAQVSAASLGETHPVAANTSPEGKAANRRIEIVVVPDLSDMPGYEELQRADQAR